MPISHVPPPGLHDDLRYNENDANNNNNNDNNNNIDIAQVQNHPIYNEAMPDQVAAAIMQEMQQTIRYMDHLSPNSQNDTSNEFSAYFESTPILNELIWDQDDLDELSDWTNSSAEAPSSNLDQAYLRFERLLYYLMRMPHPSEIERNGDYD